MRRVSLFLTALFFFNLFLVTANSAVKYGDKCPKVGQTAIASGKKFTCVKSGKKLIWNKGVVLPKNAVSPTPISSQMPTPIPSPSSTPSIIISPTATPSPTVEYNTLTYPWKSLCEKDPWVPAEWKEYQEFALSTFGCARPYRFVEMSLPDNKPNSELLSTSLRSNVSVCKLAASPNANSNVGHRANRWLFTGDVQIQVIPIEFLDYKGAAAPGVEYKKYLDYISEMFYKISDGNTRITFRTPDNYFQIGKKITDYVLPGIWKHGENSPNWKVIDVTKYRNDVFAVADPKINFSGIQMTFVLVPLSMPAEYIAHSPDFRFDNVSTNEGIVPYNYLMPPASQVNRDSWYGVEPFLHLHEVFHANGLLEDHYGDNMGQSGPNLGTGFWGNMSGMLTDFILWDKWMAGMLVDSQVICANPNLVGNYWITPATYFGKNEKLLVIPVSSTKAIAVESQRQAGQNFKLKQESIGALVYVLDTTLNGHGQGANVLRPENRTISVNQTTFVLSDAPLKMGESITTNGYRISVVETGDFGDVIKVEKV